MNEPVGEVGGGGVGSLQHVPRLLAGALLLVGVGITVALGMQLARYDIYWNQDIAGLLGLIVNYAWLFIAFVLLLIAGCLSLAQNIRRSVVAIFGSIGWLMLVLDILVQATAYATASISKFPEAGLWWLMVVIGLLLGALLVMATPGWSRVMVIIFFSLASIGNVYAIQVADRNITERKSRATASDLYYRTLQAVIAANDPAGCATVSATQPNPIAAADDCYRQLLSRHRRQDVCEKMSASFLEQMRTRGNCPLAGTVIPSVNTNTMSVNAPLPVIGRVVMKDIAASYADGYITISWSVNPAADGIVNWGPTGEYGQYLSDFSFVNRHELRFASYPGQVIHYAVRSCTPNLDSSCTSSGDFVYIAH